MFLAEGAALILTAYLCYGKGGWACLCTSAVLADRCRRLTDVTGSTLCRGSVGGISVILTDCVKPMLSLTWPGCQEAFMLLH